MQPPRESISGSIADVIETLRMGYNTGTLIVTRNTGQIVEEGYVIFTNGEVIEARVGQYNGPPALNYLKTWQTCRFSFVRGLSVSPLPRQPPLQRSSIEHDRMPLAHGLAENRVNPGPQTGPPDASHERSARMLTVPMRLPSGEAALQHLETFQLSRPHRRLLLLIDGKRNVEQLAHLMAKHSDEIQVLLNDLEHVGLIRC